MGAANRTLLAEAYSDLRYIISHDSYGRASYDSARASRVAAEAKLAGLRRANAEMEREFERQREGALRGIAESMRVAKVELGRNRAEEGAGDMGDLNRMMAELEEKEKRRKGGGDGGQPEAAGKK
ncbi:hypothetical protein TeGR_g13770 [Tetraparma gracilis]|uniref:Uncharacterized protein n=1 Tax=Tetraparma gracilis TaxID=2962635 RepID=A0ABQ6NBR7_9STRA|nr:hypothetical protein TeGR_g13770 [Tetraparma gracilis]